MARSKIRSVKLQIEHLEKKFQKNARRVDQIQRNNMEIKQFLAQLYRKTESPLS